MGLYEMAQYLRYRLPNFLHGHVQHSTLHKHKLWPCPKPVIYDRSMTRSNTQNQASFSLYRSHKHHKHLMIISSMWACPNHIKTLDNSHINTIKVRASHPDVFLFLCPSFSLIFIPQNSLLPPTFNTFSVIISLVNC